MYSPEIVERRLAIARKAGMKPTRRSREDSIEISQRLELNTQDARGNALPEGQLRRPWDSRESEFIESERLLCKIDFEYYLTRYHAVELDSGVTEDGEGGIGAGRLAESQQKFIRELGKREEQVYAEYAKHRHTEGILVYAHKCRQVMFTATSRACTLHRMLLWGPTRGFAGTLEPDGCGELYKRDKVTLENLPCWLRPIKVGNDDALYPDVKDQEIGFTFNKSRLRYQAENQKTGIGVGTQQDVSHLTEVPLWRYPGQINFSFIPSLPKSRMTLHIQEGTSAGKGGYWHEVTEACRRRDRGYESRIYIFVPVYLNSRKWRANAPDDWRPEEHTIRYAELVERTSPEWNDGLTFRPSRDHLYWWESERARHAKNGELSYFLANYPATPEQSFVNFAEGALPVELIEKMEFDVREPRIYEVETAA